MRWIIVALALSACGGSSNGTQPKTATTAAPANGARGPGWNLVMKSSSCWMGGLWSDALGEKEFERGPGIEKRCKELLGYISESPESYNALRAIDPKIVSEIAERVKKDASKDESASELAAMLGLLADAERETIHARRAADKVKEDIEKDKTQYAPDKVAASPELRKTDAVHALLNAKVGAYDADAHALGMLVVIDRMQIAHGLPKHLKIFTVGAPLQDVFGVPPPAVSDDGSMKTAPCGSSISRRSPRRTDAAFPPRSRASKIARPSRGTASSMRSAKSSSRRRATCPPTERSASSCTTSPDDSTSSSRWSDRS